MVLVVVPRYNVSTTDVTYVVLTAAVEAEAKGSEVSNTASRISNTVLIDNCLCDNVRK